MFCFKKSVCVLCAVLCAIAPVTVNAENNQATQLAATSLSTTGEGINYTEYLKSAKTQNRPDAEKVLDADDIAFSDSSDYKITSYSERDNVCMLDGGNSQVTYKFNIEQEGLYNLVLDYIQVNEDKITDIRFDVLLDGTAPSLSMKSTTMPRYWCLDGDKKFDQRGNELHRNLVQAPCWKQYALRDCEGRYNEPLLFYLSSGEHSLTLDFEYSGLCIDTVSFCNVESASEYSASSKKAVETDPITIEAENYERISDASIAVNVEKNDPTVTPNNASTLVYNTVGGSSFAQTGQSVSWNVEVEKSGYYKIAFRARQNEKNGFFSTRRFQIDGVTPYAECEDLRFQYSPDWYTYVLCDSSGQPMLFSLSAGEHELSLECVPGLLSDSMTELDDCIDELNRMFLEVNMIAGNSADKYRDYYLLDDIPDLGKNVTKALNTLMKQKQRIQKISGKDGGELSALQSMITQLQYFYKNIDKMAIKLDSFKSNISMLSAWVRDLKTQPIELDTIYIYGTGDEPQKQGGFFKKLCFNTQRLLLSFTNDYGLIGNYDQDNCITVWVSSGQDQLNIIQSLVDRDFAESKETVKTQLVPTGLLEAVMAGKGPDIAMFISGDIPVNLASRGGLADLSGYESFDSVSQRFMPNALTPYTYKDGCYALPLTQGFYMLFARMDIMNELGLKIPDTWNDLFKILPVLQRNNFELGIPSDLSTFATLALQKGGTYYNEDLSATSFSNAPETSAFNLWTDLFTKYGLSLSYDFSNRFRTGEMPIGIADYSAYALLETSAPEISGRWEMYPIPATVSDDGTLNRSSSYATAIAGSVGLQQGNTCAVILQNCKDKKAAWNFLKWFTSSDIQTDYGLALEMRMGVAARYTPANCETLGQLPWTENEKNMLYSQWKNLVLLPEIPGSYYVTRHLSNAFRQVVYNHKNATYTLNKYNEIINHEIMRKREELQSAE